jgi:hypothetical protein
MSNTAMQKDWQVGAGAMPCVDASRQLEQSS